MKILEQIPKELKAHLITKQYKKGEQILTQGDVNDNLYFIIKGKLEVFTVSTKGVNLFISTFRTGESIGVLELFSTEIHSQNVLAVEDSLITRLQKEYVLKWMKMDFDFTLFIIKMLEEYFYNTSVFARSLLSLTLKERIIVAIYQHYTKDTLKSLTKHELIQEVGTQKRSLNRVLIDLKSDGILKYEDSKFYIIDLIKLTRYYEEAWAE